MDVGQSVGSIVRLSPESGSTHHNTTYLRFRPRLCENPKLENSSGKCSLFIMIYWPENGDYRSKYTPDQPILYALSQNQRRSNSFHTPSAVTCYTPQPEPKGRCLPVSGYSLGVNFGDVNNWSRPNAAIHLGDICLTLLVLQIGLLQLK
jgi:hypothetical protein